MKKFAKAVMARTPYRIVRDSGSNRFQAIETCLRAMRGRGYSPALVIDGGAHLGSFSIEAKAIFPDAAFHLVEPQASCLQPLRELCAQQNFILHPFALADHIGEVRLAQGDTPSTGAHVGPHGTTVPASTLDALFAGIVSKEQRALLKLDLQGYELHALRGGQRVIERVEAILTEVSFFAQAYEPPMAELIAFLDALGFVLYDIASLSGRTRDNRLRQGDFVFVRKGSQLTADGGWG